MEEKLKKIFNDNNLMLVDISEYEGKKPNIKDWESRQVSYKWLARKLNK